MILISNIDQPRENHKEQQFYCHFECFRKLVNRDGVMYIMDEDFLPLEKSRGMKKIGTRMMTAAPNNGMHQTADTTALIYLNRSGRRAMPGVKCSWWICLEGSTIVG